jgi:predicted metal-binding protein
MSAPDVMEVNDDDLRKYCASAAEKGATRAKQIHPSSVVTDPWVRLKCQSGCGNYDRSYCCPPDTSTPENTRAILDTYQRAILLHKEAPRTPDRGKELRKYYGMLVELEGEMFKDGYYKAFVYLAGPCMLCKECTKLQGDLCKFRNKARPSMEAVGIDVYQTARNNGFFIYCLMLVD